MMKDFFALSLNNLRRRKLRSWLTMLGIFIGIAAVVSLISLGQGLQSTLMNQLSVISSNTLVIQNSGNGMGPPGSTSVEKLSEHDLKIVKNVAGVKYIIPGWFRMGKIEYNGYSDFIYLSDIPSDSVLLKIRYESMNRDVESGRLLKIGDTKKVILGNTAITKEKFEKDIQIGKKINIQGEEFEVVGVFEKSGDIQFNSIVFMMENDLKELLNLDDEIDMISVKVENSDNVEQIAENIKKELRKDRGEEIGEEDFSVKTPLEVASAVTSILNAVNIIVIGIATISLIVGGIGIANTMYTSVLERQKEIGTMKAIGARNLDILMIFLLESGFMGLVGGIIGALIGLGGALSVSSIANKLIGSKLIVVNLSFQLLFFAIGFSVLIGIISGVVPSYQASKLKPVDALKG